jgi:hypothetical protein
MPKFKTFEEFWPYYLREHSKPETRALHIVGTTIAGVSLAAWLATQKTKFLGLALLGSYGPAWLGHFMFERNKPAAFENPLWSLRADLMMYRLWLDGKLDEEVKRVGPKLEDATKRSSNGAPASKSASP